MKKSTNPFTQSVFPVPAHEVFSRVQKIQAGISAADLDGIIVLQRVDLFYFTGTAQNGILFIPAEGNPLLMVRRYLPRALDESAIRPIVPLSSTREIPHLIADHFGRAPRRLGMELDVMPVNEFSVYRDLLGCREYLDASPMILETRMIKSPWEINRMEEAAALSRQCFEYMQEHLRPGIPEIVFAGMVETYARGLGHGGKLRVRDYQTEGYFWHILSGPNGGKPGLLDSPMSGEGTSPAFPCGAGLRKIQADEPIMADLNNVLNGYHFDETRMLALGRMPSKAHDACKAVIEIHNHVLDAVRPGVTVGELFQRATRKAAVLGYEDSFLGPAGEKVRFIGHGIGLELVEPPIIAFKKQGILQEGMTFALEPKLTFQDAFAAGIESVFLVTASGQRLMSQTPCDILTCPV
jgi:Xaa-Pro dipeptidase